VVDGHLWGVMIVNPGAGQPLPPDTEARLAAFTDLVATAIENAENRAGLARLVEEQAALRRIATLVAHGARPEELFRTVTEEVGRLLSADISGMGRYEPDGTVTQLAAWSRAGDTLPPDGTRWALGGDNVTTVVAKAGRQARMDSEDTSGPLGVILLELGIRSQVATPITVEDRLWGLMFVGSALERPFPPDTERRLASFTELVGTAIANAESRAILARLAEAQAALRRVATLVARAEAPDELFAAVTEEVAQLLGVEFAAMGRYDSDGTVAFVAGWDRSGNPFPAAGSRWPLGGENLSTLVCQTGRPARLVSEGDLSGATGVVSRERGVKSEVATPIVVEGRLWGVMGAGWSVDQQLPPDTEARLADFTDLLATAIANADSRAELTASRARIVAAADETRRRIERDLHDGAQQQLVTLGLELRAAQAAAPRLGELESELSRVAEGLASVQDELRVIARGIHPAILAEGGLGPALKTLARRSPIPVELDVRAEARLPERVEVAAYYVVSEALTNAAKHARASVIHVELEAGEGALRVRVRDDGAGGADPTRGSGLVGLKDRVDALDGTFSVKSPLGAGTTVQVELPLSDVSHAAFSPS
jgi:signal transduction histidine kinase